jgi:predicted membrane channel-forming protein YqfA (hemolysin III family)
MGYACWITKGRIDPKSTFVVAYEVPSDPSFAPEVEDYFMEPTILRDPVCSVSHLIAATWAIFATPLLIRLSPKGAGRRVVMGMLGGTTILLFLSSGLFHAVPYPAAF